MRSSLGSSIGGEAYVSWRPERRKLQNETVPRYASDLTDAEWRLVEPLIPPAKRGGRKRRVNIRAVIDAVLFVLATGCQWNELPADLPPKSTVYDYLCAWKWDGTLARIHHTLYRPAELVRDKTPELVGQGGHRI